MNPTTVIRNAARLLGATVLAALHSLSARAADTSANQPAGAAGLEALEWAYRFGAAIPESPHLSERSTCQYNALKAILDMGRIETVAERLGEIKNWRRGVLCTDLATAYAQREGVGLMLQHYLEQARLCRAALEGHTADWQKDRITASIALAQATAGLFADAKESLADVGPAVAARVRIEELGRITDDADYAATLTELQAMGKSEELGVQEAAARICVRILESPAGELTPARLDDIAGELGNVLGRLPTLLQCPLRIDACRALLVSGCRDRGLQAMSETLQTIKARGFDARFDVAHLAQMAAVCDGVAHEPERAQELLAQAADLLETAELERGDRVNATLALAVGYATHGDAQTAWQHFRAALKDTRDQGNGRPRHVMLTGLCVAVGTAGLAMPDDVCQALEREWQRRGEPW